MNTNHAVLLGLSALPFGIFCILFRKTWVDLALLQAALMGWFAGVVASFVVKFFAYPTITFFIGIDLRGLILSSDDLWVKVAALVGIVGPVEEGAKLLAVLCGLFLISMQTRATAVFLAAVAAGLGFSMIENLDYFELYGIEVLAIRDFISSTGHATFSGVAGWAAAYALSFGQSAKQKSVINGFGWLMIGLFSASVLHGLFNTLAFHLSGITSLPTLAFGMILGISILRTIWTNILILDAPLTPEFWQCPRCQIRNFGAERFCNACGTRVLPCGN